MSRNYGHSHPSADYVDILNSLLASWRILSLYNLNEAGAIARDYLINLPDRLICISDGRKVSSEDFNFSWIR